MVCASPVDAPPWRVKHTLQPHELQPHKVDHSFCAADAREDATAPHAAGAREDTAAPHAAPARQTAATTTPLQATIGYINLAGTVPGHAPAERGHSSAERGRSSAEREHNVTDHLAANQIAKPSPILESAAVRHHLAAARVAAIAGVQPRARLRFVVTRPHAQLPSANARGDAETAPSAHDKTQRDRARRKSPRKPSTQGVRHASPVAKACGAREHTKRQTAAGAPPRPATGRSLTPDPDFFERVNGKWRVVLRRFVDAACHEGPSHASLSGAQLRAQLSDQDLHSFSLACGADTVPDDLLLAAAASGATTSTAFSSIIDGSCFARAACLCCYSARCAAAAREAAIAFRMFLKYYDASSYVKSRAFVRVVATLMRDLHADEIAEVREHTSALDETPDTIREINACGGLCVALPACQPGTLWVYSTPDGRRLLRHLARGLRKGGAPVRVTVASSDPEVLSRFKYRMYAASTLALGHAAQEMASTQRARAAPAETGQQTLLDATLSWARAHRAREPRQ